MTDPCSYTLQLVDAADAVLWDFHDPTGVVNVDGYKTDVLDSPNFGAPAGGNTFFEPAAFPGGSLLRQRDGLVTAQWAQWIKASSPDGIIAAVNKLNQLMRSGGIIKWLAPGATDTRYMDFVAAERAPLVRGQQIVMRTVFEQNEDMVGFPVIIYRQPYMRGAAISSATNKLLNATLLLDRDGGGRPDSWTWDATTNVVSESIDAATESYKFSLNSTTARLLRQNSAAASFAPGDKATLQVEGEIATVGRIQLKIEFLDNTATPIAGGDTTSGYFTPASFTKLTLTSGVAPAGTDRVRVSIIGENSAAGTAIYHLRRAQLEKASAASSFAVASESVPNDPTSSYGRLFPIYVQGNAPAPARLTATPAAALGGLHLAKRSNGGEVGGRALSAFLNGAAYKRCASGTLGTDTSDTVDANASGGHTAKCTFATNLNLVKRVTVAWTTAAEMAALKGSALLDPMGCSFDLYGRLQLPTDKGYVEVQARWSIGASARASDTVREDIIVLDGTDYVNGAGGNGVTVGGSGSGDYIDVYLGRVTIPQYATALTIELWAAQDKSSRNPYVSHTAGMTAYTATDLRMDEVFLVPADESAGFVEGSTPAAYAAANDSIKTDPNPTDPRVGLLDSSGNPMGGRGQQVGRGLFALEPGLNLVYVAPRKLRQIVPFNVFGGEGTGGELLLWPVYYIGVSGYRLIDHFTFPTGWTLFASGGAGTYSFMFGYKWTDAGDPATFGYISDIPGVDLAQGITSFSYLDKTRATPIDFLQVNNNATAAITTDTPNSMLVEIAHGALGAVAGWNYITLATATISVYYKLVADPATTTAPKGGEAYFALLPKLTDNAPNLLTNSEAVAVEYEPRYIA